MRILLLLTLVGIILITLGLTGFYINVCYRLNEIEESMKSYDREITNQNRKIRVIQDREAEKSDKVIITYEPKDTGVKFGGEGI